tara:strand:- start:751 stop:1038 length:288 start_codon:yes stop_codon:yes gene_type:complete
MNLVEIEYASDALDYDVKHYNSFLHIDVHLFDLLSKKQLNEFDQIKDEDDQRDWCYDMRNQLLHEKMVDDGDLIELNEWSNEYNCRPKLMLKLDN